MLIDSNSIGGNNTSMNSKFNDLLTILNRQFKYKKVTKYPKKILERFVKNLIHENCVKIFVWVKNNYKFFPENRFERLLWKGDFLEIFSTFSEI